MRDREEAQKGALNDKRRDCNEGVPIENVMKTRGYQLDAFEEGTCGPGVGIDAKLQRSVSWSIQTEYYTMRVEQFGGYMSVHEISPQ